MVFKAGKMRSKDGTFVKGKKHGYTQLPQTIEGWIERFIDKSYVGDGKKGHTTTYISKGLKRIIWEATDAVKQINKKARAKVQADPEKRARKNELNMINYRMPEHREHWINVASYRYHMNPELYAEKYHDWYEYRGGKAIVAEYNRIHSAPWDSPVEKAKKQARVRDGGMCKWALCGKRADQVHHIVRDPERPELRYTLSNLISYCREHHAEFHKAKGEGHLVPFILSVQRKQD